jgi:hypothetical protein
VIHPNAQRLLRFLNVAPRHPTRLTSEEHATATQHEALEAHGININNGEKSCHSSMIRSEIINFLPPSLPVSATGNSDENRHYLENT